MIRACLVVSDSLWPHGLMIRACSVVSDSLWPHGLQPARLLCPWNFPGKNTGVNCHFLLQGIFLTQESNLHLLHWQVIFYQLSHWEQIWSHLPMVLAIVKTPSHAESLQWCLTLSDPMDCSPPNSSVHGILQARILEWVAISFSMGSCPPRGRTCIS